MFLKRIMAMDPVIYVAVVQAFLVMLLSFDALEWAGLKTQDDLMVVVAFLTAVGAIVTAYKTSRTLLAPVVEAFKAAVAVGAIYGLQLTTEQTGSIIALITMVAAFWHQTQVSPLTKGTFKLTA